MTKTLEDLAATMAQIDFCQLVTKTEGGAVASRPMSNNGEVDYDGDSYFFTWDSSRMAADIRADPRVGLTMQGSAGVMGVVGAPPPMLMVQGKASLVHDRERFAKHWNPDLKRWFEQGIDTPGMVMIHVRAERIAYWDGEDQGEVIVGPASAA